MTLNMLYTYANFNGIIYVEISRCSIVWVLYMAYIWEVRVLYAKIEVRDQRVLLGIKNVCCSYRWPEFRSQYTHPTHTRNF